jgi:hypothetical protein
MQKWFDLHLNPGEPFPTPVQQNTIWQSCRDNVHHLEHNLALAIALTE